MIFSYIIRQNFYGACSTLLALLLTALKRASVQRQMAHLHLTVHPINQPFL
jgi:hypothetical protein